MIDEFNDAELEAYLDESLGPTRAAEIEDALRDNDGLLRRLSLINGRRDAGIHTLGEIWRRNQVGVPSQETMASFLVSGLSDAECDYIEFRLEVLRCPFTLAMWRDIQDSDANASASRQREISEKGAKFLSQNEED